MDAAVTAVSAARDAKADDFAPVELDRAEEALAAARDAIERRDHAVAQNLAEQAELDASLAAARSRAAAGRAAVARAVEENARLRRELLGDGGSR